MYGSIFFWVLLNWNFEVPARCNVVECTYMCVGIYVSISFWVYLTWNFAVVVMITTVVINVVECLYMCVCGYVCEYILLDIPIYIALDI